MLSGYEISALVFFLALLRLALPLALLVGAGTWLGRRQLS